MRKLKFILDRKSLEIIYTSFIRLILEYADVVWDNCTQYEINALEKIQIEAARIVTGTTKLVSLDKLYQETGRETLEDRRKKNKLCSIKCLIISLLIILVPFIIAKQEGNMFVVKSVICNNRAIVMYCTHNSYHLLLHIQN